MSTLGPCKVAFFACQVCTSVLVHTFMVMAGVDMYLSLSMSITVSTGLHQGRVSTKWLCVSHSAVLLCLSKILLIKQLYQSRCAWAGSVRFTKETRLGGAAAQAPQRGSGAEGADPGAASGSQGIPLPVMWGGGGSAAARQMLAGLGLAGLGLSRPGAWGPGLDMGQMAQHGAQARALDMHFAWMPSPLLRSPSPLPCTSGLSDTG